MKIKTTALDRLFSQYVRSRAGWRCEYSGDTNVQLDCAHVLSRRHVLTRWNPQNAVCLSRRWHMWFTDHPHEWADWTRGYLGADTVDALQAQAYAGDKLTDADKIAIGEDLIERIKAMGETPVCGIGRRLSKKAAKKKASAKVGSGKYKRKVSGEVVER